MMNPTFLIIWDIWVGELKAGFVDRVCLSDKIFLGVLEVLFFFKFISCHINILINHHNMHSHTVNSK